MEEAVKQYIKENLNLRVYDDNFEPYPTLQLVLDREIISEVALDFKFKLSTARD